MSQNLKKRNSGIIKKIKIGVAGSRIAKDFGITRQRVNQIKKEYNISSPKKLKRYRIISPNAMRRWKVWNRDGFKCLSCGDSWFLEIDHIIPKSKGGTDDIENFQTLCKNCNAKKGSKIINYRTGEGVDNLTK